MVSVAGFPAAAGLGAFAWQNASTGNPAPGTTVNLSGLGPHTWLRVNFEFIAFDSWDGQSTTWGPDYLNLLIGASNTYISITNFPASIADHGVSGPFDYSSVSLVFADGNSYAGNSGWSDSVWHVAYQIPHTASTAVLNFYAYGAGWQGGSDESFGLDNILIETDGAVPEPATFLTLGLGLAVLAALRRVR